MWQSTEPQWRIILEVEDPESGMYFLTWRLMWRLQFRVRRRSWLHFWSSAANEISFWERLTHIHTSILFLEFRSSSELGVGCLQRGHRPVFVPFMYWFTINSEILQKNTLSPLLFILLGNISTSCGPVDCVMTCYRWMCVYNGNYVHAVCTETVDLSSKEETEQKTRPSKAIRPTVYFKWQWKTRLSPRSIHECNLHFGEDDLFRFCDALGWW